MKKAKKESVKPFKIDGASYYPESVKGKTLDQFLKHESHLGLSKAALTEAYEILSKPKAFTTPVVETKDSEVAATKR